MHLYILLVLHAHEKTIFNFLSFKGASKCVSFICALLQIIIIITEKHTKTETLTASALTEESPLQTVREMCIRDSPIEESFIGKILIPVVGAQGYV